MLGHSLFGNWKLCERDIYVRRSFLAGLPMTKLLDRALTAARRLPPMALTPDEETALATSKAAASRGEFASDEQVTAVWAKHGL
jgi:hypothetical protein